MPFWPFKKNKKSRLNNGAGQSTFDRMMAIGRANVNDALDKAEDPVKMANQYVRDFQATTEQAKQQTAEVIGSVRAMEADQAQALREIDQWQERALKASTRADRLEASGDAEGAARSNQLAQKALQKKIGVEKRISELDPKIESGNRSVDQLKNAMEIVGDQLAVVIQRRDDLSARSHAVDAQDSVVDAITSMNSSDPSSDMGRLEGAITRKESQAQGRLEVAAASTEYQYAELDRGDEADEAALQLAELKRDSSGQITSGQ